jgi:hypothetical protein
MMIGLAVRLCLIGGAYVVGERLAAAILQQGNDEGLGFWGVMINAFDSHTYTLAYFAPIIVVGFLILLCDAITPGRMKALSLSLAAAASAAYYYIAYYGYDYASNFQHAYDAYLSRFPIYVHQTVGTVLFALSLALPFVSLIVLKIAVAVIRNEARGARGGTTATA